MRRLRQFDVLCCSGYTLLCLVWRTCAGLPLTWDLLNHHLYVAHAWWGNRLPEELFAAGAQSYQNPLPYVPFYFAYLTSSDSLIIGVSMAIFHSVNLWLLHFIACRLIPPTDRMRRLLIICGVLLGALSPGFVYEVGSSFADVVVSVPTMSALLLLMLWKSRPISQPADWRPVYFAGLLAGLAMGLKPTALVFSSAMFASLLLLSGRQAWNIAWRAMLSGIAGIALTGGAHAWMLWKSFSNPVFPLFNAYFRSPWFPPVNLVSDRFRPVTLEAALSFPLNMANSFKRISFEDMVVDIRPIWLIGLVLCAVAPLLLKRWQFNRPHILTNTDKKLFWLCLTLSIPAWIYSSGNIRYAIEILLLLGPAISSLALLFIGKNHIWSLLAILLPLFAQTVLATTINALSLPGINREFWRPSLLEISIPEPLTHTPSYYLSLQSLSFASLAPLFPSNSRFMNLIGTTALTPEAKLIVAMKSDQHDRALPARTLYFSSRPIQQEIISQTEIETQNAALSEYGLKIQEKDCVNLNWSQKSPFSNNKHQGVIISCAIAESEMHNKTDVSIRKAIDTRIDNWARKCPEVFSPMGFSSVQRPKERQRLFANTEVLIVKKKVRFSLDTHLSQLQKTSLWKKKTANR